MCRAMRQKDRSLKVSKKLRKLMSSRARFVRRISDITKQRQTKTMSTPRDQRSVQNANPKTIDEYLAGVNQDQRAALEQLRRIIHATAPGAEEGISYGLAAFRWNGRPLVAFGASANHCAFYPMNSTLVEAHRSDLARFDTSKGTIRFQPSAPLPAALVRKLIKARLTENTGIHRATRSPAKRAQPRATARLRTRHARAYRSE